MFEFEPPKLSSKLKPNDVYKELSPKMKVALNVLETNDVDKTSEHFSKLVNDMEGIVSRMTIHEALDSLLDQGTLKASWLQTPEKHWIRGYKVGSEGQNKMLRRLYYSTHKEEKT